MVKLKVKGISNRNFIKQRNWKNNNNNNITDIPYGDELMVYLTRR